MTYNIKQEERAFLNHATRVGVAIWRKHGFKCEVVHLMPNPSAKDCYFGAKERGGDRWVLFRSKAEVSLEEAEKVLVELPLEQWRIGASVGTEATSYPFATEAGRD